MSTAARPFPAIGISLVTAGALAVSPIAPPLPDVPSVVRDVSLAASPFDVYAEIVDATLLSTDFFIQLASADPPALPPGATLPSVLAGLITDPAGRAQEFAAKLEALVQNLPTLAAFLRDNLSGIAQSVIDNVAAGRYDQAVQNVLAAAQFVAATLGQELPGLSTPLLGPGLTTILSDPELGGLIAFAPIIVTGPAVNAVGFTAVAAQEALDALVAGDAEGFLNAAIQGPGQVARGALFGGYGSFALGTPGLLGLPLSANSVLPGPVYTALRFGKVAQALITPPPAAVSGVADFSTGQRQTVALDINDPPAKAVAPAAEDTDDVTNVKAAVKPPLPSLFRSGSTKRGQPDDSGETADSPGQGLRSAVRTVTGGITGSLDGVRDGLKKLTYRNDADETEKSEAGAE